MAKWKVVATIFKLHRIARRNKKVRIRVLGGGTRSKNKLQFPPQADRHRKPTNVVAKRLGRQMGAAHTKYTLVGPNCRNLAIGNWNVLSLTGRAGACL